MLVLSTSSGIFRTFVIWFIISKAQIVWVSAYDYVQHLFLSLKYPAHFTLTIFFVHFGQKELFLRPNFVMSGSQFFQLMLL